MAGAQGKRNVPSIPVGTRFGRWTVLSEGDPDVCSGRMHVVQCDCGNKSLVSAQALKRGGSTQCWSCGHPPSPDVQPGNRFGRWTVICYVQIKSRRGGAHYKCRCDCGAIKNVPGRDLRRGATKQCRSCASKAGRATVAARKAAQKVSLA